MEKILETAAENNTIVEINSSPYRLDMDWRFGNLARQLKIKTALNPDAHSTAGLQDYKYGINIARKAGFSKADVLNSYNVNQVKEQFRIL
jgi:DNA polymerase (family 10)